VSSKASFQSERYCVVLVSTRERRLGFSFSTLDALDEGVLVEEVLWTCCGALA
jgi:hypothetical protein